MGKVNYYTTIGGESPVRDFIESLSPTQKAKIARIISYIENYGLITVIRQVKKLSGTPLWEIRILGQDSMRVIYATIDKDGILLLHGFFKKSQQTPVKELTTSLRRFREWTERKEKR